MRTILFILQKEFLQVLRNKMMLPIIFIVPIVQMLILVHAATYEIKEIKLYIVDNHPSALSRSIALRFSQSSLYRFKGYAENLNVAEYLLKDNEADMVLVIPPNLEKTLRLGNDNAKVQVLINAINGRSAGLMNAYTQGILLEESRALAQAWYSQINIINSPQINTEYSYWYNKTLDYKMNMLPGIIVILVTVIGMFLTSLNLVREKETGTIEQINVTPIKKYQFLLGKLIPFWIIALIELSIGLIVGRYLFGLPIEGSLFTLYIFASVYLLVALGIGLFLSTISQTQQQVMFLAYFFMLIFIMMSGLFTPTESMPAWAQNINIINPFAYFIKAIRMILLKGSTFMDILPQLLNLFIIGVTMILLSVWRYRKTA